MKATCSEPVPEHLNHGALEHRRSPKLRNLGRSQGASQSPTLMRRALVAGMATLVMACGDAGEPAVSEHRSGQGTRSGQETRSGPETPGGDSEEGNGEGRGSEATEVEPRETAAAPPEPLGRIAAPGAGPLMPPGQPVGPQTALVTGETSLPLNLRGGARLRFGPQSRGRLGEEAPAQVILGRGVLTASLSPQGNGERPPLRIGTPAGSVVLPGAGRCLVSVSGSGGAQVWVEAGRIELWHGGERHSLGPGQRMTFGESSPTVFEGDAGELAAGFASSGEGTALETGFRRAMTDFDTALRELQSANAQVRSHEQAHREAIAAGSENAAVVQRQAILQVAGRESIRRQALGAWEQGRAWAMLKRQRPDPTTARRPEFRQALGLTESDQGSQGERD